MKNDTTCGNLKDSSRSRSGTLDKEFTIEFTVAEYILEALEKSAELASKEYDVPVSADQVAKAIIMRTIGKIGDTLIY